MLIAIAVVVTSRFWLALTLPLTDTTEARFSEMARKMVETGDWLVPQHDYGVPYLAKPPLAMWLSALGIEAFGAGELGPRIFILLATLGFGWVFYTWMRRELGLEAARMGVLVLLSAFLFFVATAAVMTDMILTITVSGALLAFWRRLQGGGPGVEIAMYVAAALGMLTKGPLAWVLIGTPIVAWTVLQGQTRTVWQRFFWIRGALLTVAIALPWYVAAELRNPGFLQYFIVGEHLGRFLQPGWSGDLYGRAHDAPRGTIWLFLLIGALPWTLLIVPALLRARPAVARNWRERRGLIVFALAAALTPLALFTLAGNIIFPYALPALPLTVVAFIALLSDGNRPARWLGITAATAAAFALVLAVLAQAFAPRIEQESQRAVVAAGDALLGAPGEPIYYWHNRFFSAEYYSAGRASTLEDAGPANDALRAGRDFVLVVDADQVDTLPAELRAAIEPVADIGEQTLFEPSYSARAASRDSKGP